MEKLQDLKKRLDTETDKYEDGERVSKSELIGVGYELIELVEEMQSVISRLRCEECGDQLGTDWEAGSVILCGDCK